MNSETTTKRPSFGIIGAEFYFPKNYVDQTELEKFDGENTRKDLTGKYTKGLGQFEMSFCYENEDVCSMALSVTSKLLKNYQVDKQKVGFLAVGTETMVDKSKSVRTVLMDLFKTGAERKVNGDCSMQEDIDCEPDIDIEGADVKNACYGGTQALFHAIDWLYSNYEFEGRMAIVVCADVAVYARGPARCTGGAGAIAFLLGPHAPLVFEPGLRAFHSRNVYDFYKPVSGTCTEYPVVNGSESIDEYMLAVRKCYLLYGEKYRRQNGNKPCLNDFYAVLFHSPYTRLAQKALCSLAFTDYKRGITTGLLVSEKLKGLNQVPHSDSSKEVQKAFWDNIMGASKDLLIEKLDPHTEFNRRLGNMYTPSLWAQFLNAIKNVSKSNEELDKQRILLYSYGSGSIASVFSIRFNFPPVNCSKQSPGELSRASFAALRKSVASAYQQLNQRQKRSPAEFEAALDARERLFKNSEEYSEEKSLKATSSLFPDSYYLRSIDADKRRFYAKYEPATNPK